MLTGFAAVAVSGQSGWDAIQWVSNLTCQVNLDLFPVEFSYTCATPPIAKPLNCLFSSSLQLLSLLSAGLVGSCVRAQWISSLGEVKLVRQSRTRCCRIDRFA